MWKVGVESQNYIKNMNEDILKSNRESVSKKIWKVWHAIWDWDGTGPIVFLLVACALFYGLVSFLMYKDEKNYPYGEYELTYRVYYTPSVYKDYTITHNRPIFIESQDGTNRVKKYNDGTVIETNAPIEKLRYVKK